MWDAAIALTYEGPARGREAKALGVFTDALTVYGKLAAEGICAEPEVFHHLVGGGMMLVKVQSMEKALEILEMEEVRKMLEVAVYTVDGFEMELMVTGEKVMQDVALYGEVGAELGYI